MSPYQLISVNEVASLLCTTPNAIYVAIAEGRDGLAIPQSVKVGRRRLFREIDVAAWIEKLAKQ